MATEAIGVLDAQVALVSDHSYEDVVTSMMQRARRRVWVSVFMIDLATPDPKLRVLGAMHELAAAQWRGVDVRLLIGGSRDNLQMAECSATALAVAKQLGLTTRWLTSRKSRGSHVKFVLADDEVLLGSHNWSLSSFALSTQDSVWFQSPELSAYLCDAFAAQWLRRPTVDTQ
jgi:phosphatidylserine/phosphatidylglycerophosphate/cardiolipin synthase-like enzyme